MQSYLKKKIENISHKTKKIIDGDFQTRPNNQASIIITMNPRKGVILALHETRIFAFRHTDMISYDDARQSVLDQLLNILTIRKFRIISYLEIIFRMMDIWCLVGILIAVILVSVSKVAHDAYNDNIGEVISSGELTIIVNETIEKVLKNTSLTLAVVGMEFFVKFIEAHGDMWILSRLKLLVTIAFFIIYSILLSIGQ